MPINLDFPSTIPQALRQMKTPPATRYSRGYLPHYDINLVYQAITFRQADSLPATVVERLLKDTAMLSESQQEVENRKRVEEYLDAGHGSCRLRKPEIAIIVRNALLHHDSTHYHLAAWVIMPNHVHALLAAIPDHEISTIVQSWKKFTARHINNLDGRSGAFWQREYWDRYIRDENHFRDAMNYIHLNPVKAGLVKRPEDWPWSSAAVTG